MAHRANIWRPKGKTDNEILQSLLIEASTIIAEFDKMSVRHADELASYREENPKNSGKEDFERWKQETLLKNLFEIAEPSDFDYEFHERRRIFINSLEEEEGIDLGSIFIDVCTLAGIRPLFATILKAHQLRPLIYHVVDPRSRPVFAPAMFDLLEFDVTLLRLYVQASEFYGLDQFLLILKSRR